MLSSGVEEKRLTGSKRLPDMPQERRLPFTPTAKCHSASG